MEKEKIAIIGSGISGITCSLFLSDKYDVHLYEKNNYLGGHTRTKNVIEGDFQHNIDTGFIVFNDKNYQDLNSLFNFLNIETENSNMSFSVSIENPDLEYGGRNLLTLFAQKKNIFSSNYIFFIYEIIKFYNHCKKISLTNEYLDQYTLDDFLTKYKYTDILRDFHIYPIVSSIWSSNRDNVKKFPLKSFINFFNNHGLFNIFNRPQWKFVKGGSKKYIDSILKKRLFKYYINKLVKKIQRNDNENFIIFENNEKIKFNKIILATHADQSLDILEKPTKNENDILSKFKYSKNLAYLHSDINFMPKRKSIWSSWNFKNKKRDQSNFSLTYWMNLLQNIPGEKNYFVTINPNNEPNNYLDKTTFEHPIFNLETLLVQKKISEIQGLNNIWYCGSYCGHGFHEDGIQSSAYVAKLLGVNLPWKRNSNFINRLEYL